MKDQPMTDFNFFLSQHKITVQRKKMLYKRISSSERPDKIHKPDKWQCLNGHFEIEINLKTVEINK